MSKKAFARRPGRRSASLLSVAALATTGMIATASPAAAVITEGPEDAVTGLPSYMIDDAGMALQLCLDACVEAPEEGGPAPEPANPNHAPYFAAEAAVGAFSISYEVATDQEAEGEPAEVVNAALIKARDVAPNATFQVRGPWGLINAQSDDTGRVVAEQVGHVKTFLRPVSFSGDMIGDAHTPSRVVGSPSGFNKVTVTGPGINGSTDQFMLLGQLADDMAMTDVSVKSLDLGTSATQVSKQITYTNYGTADANPTVTVGGMNPARFQVLQSSATVPAGSTSLITVTYTPKPNRSHSAILSISDNSLAALPKQVSLSGQGPDTLAPKVSSLSPGKRATGIRPGKSVKVQYNEAVRGLNRQTFTLVDNSNGRKVRASVSKVRQSYVLNPRSSLKRGTSYTVKLNGGAKAIRDLAGNAAKDTMWRFTTR